MKVIEFFSLILCKGIGNGVERSKQLVIPMHVVMELLQV
jgi:hypothetical protein